MPACSKILNASTANRSGNSATSSRATNVSVPRFGILSDSGERRKITGAPRAYRITIRYRFDGVCCKCLIIFRSGFLRESDRNPTAPGILVEYGTHASDLRLANSRVAIISFIRTTFQSLDAARIPVARRDRRMLRGNQTVPAHADKTPCWSIGAALFPIVLTKGSDRRCNYEIDPPR